jgi:hypothetical protein
MQKCERLTGTDRHALHVPCTSRLGSLAKPYLRWSLQGHGACTLHVLGLHLVLSHVLCQVDRLIAVSRCEDSCKGGEVQLQRGVDSASGCISTACQTHRDAADTHRTRT